MQLQDRRARKVNRILSFAEEVGGWELMRRTASRLGTVLSQVEKGTCQDRLWIDGVSRVKQGHDTVATEVPYPQLFPVPIVTHCATEDWIHLNHDGVSSDRFYRSWDKSNGQRRLFTSYCANLVVIHFWKSAGSEAFMILCQNFQTKIELRQAYDLQTASFSLYSGCFSFNTSPLIDSGNTARVEMPADMRGCTDDQGNTTNSARTEGIGLDEEWF
uniref:WH1 domain-containing protein n=1 Tax=Steinernema glaseri TaxID=37863 RepID=A0A1I7YFF8_9BILA